MVTTMCDLNSRGVVYVERVDDAAYATKQALGHAHSLIAELEPTIGQERAIHLSDAVSGVAAGYETEITARLVAIVTAMLGGPGDVLVAPEEEGRRREPKSTARTWKRGTAAAGDTGQIIKYGSDAP